MIQSEHATVVALAAKVVPPKRKEIEATPDPRNGEALSSLNVTSRKFVDGKRVA